MRESALGDFGYVVNNAPKDFILLPEVYTWIGRTEILLDNPRQAEVAFAKARELKADYWPAYSHWAEYLLAKGRRPDALKLVTAGLQQSPDARVLLELYKVLGGKASELPKPLPKKQPEAEPPAGGEPSPPPAPQPAEADPGKDRPADDAYPAAK
jgi:tetratricopeptide (TPR) repeat protein